MMIFFSFVGEGGGRGGGRGHLKSLRLQPGKGAGEKRSNEEGGVIINFITNIMLSHQTPPVPIPHKKNKVCLEQ